MDIKASRHIKFRHLAAFVETVRLGSLKAAADRVGLTQSAITKTLNDLDRQVGSPLLHRDRGGARLTPAGQAFLPFAQQSLAALGQGLDTLQSAGAGQAQTLRIGALPSVAAGVLPDAVGRFLALAPGVRIRVQDGAIAALVDQLRDGALDLVIGRMGTPEAMVGLTFAQLYTERGAIVVAAGHPLAKSRSLLDLRNALVIYPPRSAAIRPLVDRFMLAEGADLQGPRIESVSDAFGRAMTLGPQAPVWIISQGVVARDITAGRLVTLPIDSGLLEGPVGIMARAEDEVSPQVRVFRQALMACLDGKTGMTGNRKGAAL